MATTKKYDPSKPGITRQRRGKGWSYRTEDGQAVDKDTRARISALVIPPAWRQVWISPVANGRIQAVGSDEAGRRQYMYHQHWTSSRHKKKFSRIAEFAARLPDARDTVATHLALEGMPKERALAAAFRLLDLGHFRIGGDVYAATNGSFGLSTLQRNHVRREGKTLVFEYVAKSGLDRIERINNDDLLTAIGTMTRRRSGGEKLLAYRDGEMWRDLAGSDINSYIKEMVGAKVSAKDFRTWHGTSIAAVVLADEFRSLPKGKKWNKKSTKRAITKAIKATSKRLGNTPSVCRSSYVDPRVLAHFERGTVIDRAVAKARKALPSTVLEKDDIVSVAGYRAVERAVIALLESSGRQRR